MDNIAIFIADSNGRFSVPASKDGAVPILVEHLVEKNNTHNIFNMTVITFYDKEAYDKSRKYENVDFVWVRVPKIIKFIDNLTYMVIKKIMKDKKAISYKTIASLLFYILYGSVFLKKSKFDKVIFENNIPLAWIIRLSRYKGKYYYHFHNLPRIDARCKKVFQLCDGYICVSNFVKKYITSDKSSIGKIKEDKVKILYNCIDTNKFNRSDNMIEEFEINKLKCNYDIKENENILIFVGRLSKEKGVDKVIKSINYMKSQNIHLLIVGSVMHGDNTDMDEYQRYLYQLVKEQNHIITFTGYVNQSDINRLYKIADVAILPSMWEEPAGLTMIEAMACGIPLVTCKSGGIEEYVNNNAVLLDKNSNVEEEIANNVDFFLGNKKKAKEYGEIASEYAIKNFNLENYYNCFVSLMQQM